MFYFGPERGGAKKYDSNGKASFYWSGKFSLNFNWFVSRQTRQKVSKMNFAINWVFQVCSVSRMKFASKRTALQLKSSQRIEGDGKNRSKIT